MFWVTHKVPNSKPIQLLMHRDQQVAHVTWSPDGWRAIVLSGIGYKLPTYYWTFDSLEEAKDYCTAQVVAKVLT